MIDDGEIRREFIASDTYRNRREFLTTRKDAEPVLGELCNYGWIRKVQNTTGKFSYEVYPDFDVYYAKKNDLSSISGESGMSSTKSESKFSDESISSSDSSADYAEDAESGNQTEESVSSGGHLVTEIVDGKLHTSFHANEPDGPDIIKSVNKDGETIYRSSSTMSALEQNLQENLLPSFLL
jgi:hypothetical protein